MRYHERNEIRMDENRKDYEPPKVTLYRFDDNELILTASGEDYAANALNAFFGGTNTTFERQ